MNNHDKVKQAFSGLQAPDDMAEKVMKKARGEMPEKTHRPYRIGRVAIVAVVLVLTAATALAAVIPSILQIGKSFWNDTAVVSEVRIFPISEELRKYINDTEWEVIDESSPDSYSSIVDYPKGYPSFSSLDEAGAFFGVQFPKNTMLTEFVNFSGDEERGPVRSNIAYHERKDEAGVFVLTTYMLDTENAISFQYLFSCGTNTNETVAYERMDIAKFDEERHNIQKYTSPVNGIEAVLYTVDPELSSAVFSLNDISHYMSSFYWQNLERDPYDIFKEIIDAYE